jgi:tetratricopeptide (TPR) repeat protein
LHGRIADVLQSDTWVSEPIEPGVIARHLREAGRHVESATWFSRAGERAVRTAALAEALQHFEHGLTVLKSAPEDEERDRVELTLSLQSANATMAARGMGIAELEPMWARAIELAERTNNDEPATAAMNGLAMLYLDRGDYDACIGVAERILEIGIRTDLRIARIRAHTTLGLALFFLGEGRQALVHLDQASAEIDPVDFVETEGSYLHQNATAVASHAMAASVCSWLGLPDRAVDEAEAALQLAERLSRALGIIYARFSLADVRLQRGEPDLALAAAQEGLKVADELRYPFGQGVTQLFAGAAMVQLGRPGGFEIIEKALMLLVDNGTQSGSGRGFCILTESQLAAGRREEAAATAELGLAAGRDTGQLAFESELLRLKAAAVDDPRYTEELLREALDVAAAQGAELFSLRATTDLAELLSGTGRVAEASELLQPRLGAWAEQAVIADHRRALDLAAQILSYSR